MTIPPEPIDPREAGEILKKARKKRGFTQGQVIEAVGIPNQSYLSALENGRYNVANSEYLPLLAQVLELTIDDIRAINPAAVITVAPSQPASSAFAASAQYGNIPLEEDEIDEALLEAAREYGDKAGFEGLADPVTQRALQSIDFRQRPATPEEWLSKFLKFRDELRSSHDA